jgi:hypothetical protein
MSIEMRNLEQAWVLQCDDCGEKARVVATTLTDRDIPAGWVKGFDHDAGTYEELCPACVNKRKK